MFKLVSGIGKPVKLDIATVNKDHLIFARVMVKVTVDQLFHKSTCFENEKGFMMELEGGL